MYQAAATVDKYYTPLLFIFGTLGNSLSLAVFCMNVKYRSQSASYYLSALAISDTGFLVNLLAVWLESVHGGIITSGIMCPLVMYLGQVTCFMSVYLTVAFSIERYVAVHYPLSRPRICTRSKARKIIAALTGVALLFFSYAWMIAQVVELPARRDDYYELYRQNLTPTTRFNLSQDLDSSELLSFPVELEEKRESYPFSASSSAQLLASLDEQDATILTNKDVFEKVQNCGNGSHHSHNKSIRLYYQNQSTNCTRLHLDGMVLKRFPHSTESSNEDATFTSEEKKYEEEQILNNEEVFSFEGYYVCTVPEDYFRISEIANYLDSVVTLIIPFFLITFFNVRIAICVWKLQRQRQNIVATPATSSTAAESINHHHSSLRCSKTSSIRHKRKSSTKGRSSIKCCHTRQHLSEQRCNDSLKNNVVGENNPQQVDIESAYNFKSRKGNVIFQDDKSSSRLNTGETAAHFKDSSSSGSEENMVAENCMYDKMSPTCNTNVGTTPNRKNSMEALQATSTFLGKSSPIGTRSSCRGTSIKWEQKHKAAASTRATAKSEHSVTRGKGSGTHHATSNAAEVRVTKTLLLVSTVFLVLNLPAHAIRCFQFIQLLRGTTEGHELLQAVQTWTNILFNTNFAVNFLLYCVSGKNFRKSVRNIILRKCNDKLPNSWKSMSKTKHCNIMVPNNKTARGDVRPPTRRKEQRQVTEIVELEERREVPVYPNNNVCAVNRGVVQEASESMTV